MSSQPHISVCVCTFKRPGLLKKTIDGVLAQKSDGLFTFSLVIVDNDKQQSAAATVEEVRKRSSASIKYDVEPNQNIALARNRAVSHANGQFIAFIDDDEIPNSDWLALMLHCLSEYGVDGVLGPVVP